MEDDKRLSADPNDLELLSPSNFGPPAYASTALKPEDGRSKQDASSSVDESLTSREILSGLTSQNKTATVTSEKITELLGSIKTAHMMEATHPSSNDISLDISQVSSNPPSIITDDYSMLSSSQFLMPVVAAATAADSEDIATIPSGSPMPSESPDAGEHLSDNTSTTSNLTSNSTDSLKSNISDHTGQGDTMVNQLDDNADNELDAKLADNIVTQSDSQHRQLQLDTGDDEKLLQTDVGGAPVTQWSGAMPTTVTTSQLPSQYFKMSSNISTASETDQTLVVPEQQDELSSSLSSLNSQPSLRQQQLISEGLQQLNYELVSDIPTLPTTTADAVTASTIVSTTITTITTTATAYGSIPSQVDTSSRVRSASLPSINLATALEDKTPQAYRVGSLNNVMLRKQGDGLESNIPVMLTAPSVMSQSLTAVDDQAIIVTSSSSVMMMDDRPLLLDGENRSDGGDQGVGGARTDVSNVLEREGTLVGADSDEDSVSSSSTASETNFLTDNRPYSLLDHQLQFSLFEPSNLDAVMARESLLSSLRPPVTAGQEKMVHVNPSLSQTLQVISSQSLDVFATASLTTQSCSVTTISPAVTMVTAAPSTVRQDVSVTRSDFLHDTSKLSEVERPTAVGFTEWDKSPTVTMTTPSHTEAVISSSLHDVVKVTSSGDILPYLEPQGILDSDESDSVSTTEPTMDFGKSLDGVDLPQGVTDNFGDVKDTNSFLKELEQDELLIEQQNTTSKVNITSTLSNSWANVSPQNSSELPSIGTYFAEGSDKLGELSTKLSPSQRPRFSDTHDVMSPAVTTQSEGSLDDSTSNYYSSSSSSSSHDQDTTMIADPTLMDHVMTGEVDPQAIGSHDAVVTSLLAGTVTLTDSTLLLPELSTVNVTATTSQLVSINSSLLTPQTPSMAHMTGDFDLTAGFTPPLTLFPTSTSSMSSIAAPGGGLSSSGDLTIEKVTSLSSIGSTKLSSVGDLLPTGGLTIGEGLAPTSNLTIGEGLAPTSGLTIGGGLASTSGLTIGGGLAPTSGLTIGGGLAPTSGLTIGGSLSSSTSLTFGGSLISSSSLTTGVGLSSSTGLTIGRSLLSSSSLTTGGGLSSNTGLIIGRSLLSSSGFTTQGGLLPTSSLTVGGGLSSSGSLSVGGGLTSNSGLTLREGLSSNGSLAAGGLLPSKSLTIGGGLLPSGGLNIEGLSTNSISTGLPSVSSVTIGDFLSHGNLNTGTLFSSSSLTGRGLSSSNSLTTGRGLLSSSNLTTGRGLSSSGGLLTGGGLFSSGGLTSGGVVSSANEGGSSTIVQTGLQSSVSLTGTLAGGIISGGSLTSTSPIFQHLHTTSSLLTSSGFSLGSGLMTSSGFSLGSGLMTSSGFSLGSGLMTSSGFPLWSGLMTSSGSSPLKSSHSADSGLMERTSVNNTTLTSTGDFVTSSGYSPSSGLLTVGGLKLSSGLSPSITSEITPSTQQPTATTTISTVEWPSHVQAILDSSTFDVKQFLLSLQANHGQLTQQVNTALTDDEVNSSVIMSSSVSSSTSVQEVTSDEEESVTNDLVSSSLTDIAGTLVSSIVTTNEPAVPPPLTTSTDATSITTDQSLTFTTTTTTTTTTTAAPATVSTQLQSITSLTSLYTSPSATGMYNYSSLSAPYAAEQLRTTTPHSSVSAVKGIPFTTTAGTITTLASSSSFHTLSLEDLERETSTPTLPINLPPSTVVYNKSLSSLSALSYTTASDAVSSGSSRLLGISRSAPLSSKYYTPLVTAAARVTITPSLHAQSLPKTVNSSIGLSSPGNVRRQIFPPSNAPKITSPSSSSVRKQNVSLIYSSAGTASENISSVKQLKALHTPSSVTLSKPCCIGDSVQTHIPITNSCERWIQCKAQVIQLHRDSKQVSSEESSTFMYHPCCYVGPHKTENLKITFAPPVEGQYEAILKIEPSYITATSSETIVVEKIIIKAIAEKPQLWLKLGDEGSSDMLMFGEVVVGHSVTATMELANYGQADLPVRMVMSTPTQHSGRFSFEDVPVRIQSPRLQLSPTIRPRQVVSLLLPGKPLNSSAEVHKLNVTFSALSDAHLYYGSIPSKPEECSASIIVEVEATTIGTHNHSITTIPMKALIGVVKLVTPTGLQAMSLSCAAGQSVSRSLPLKNSGNLPFTVLLNITGDHFTVQPDTLKLSPQEEAEVVIVYSSGSSSSVEGSLKMLVRPGDKCYQIKLRGNCTAVTSSSSGSLKSEGQLLTSAQTVFWGGVPVGSTKMEKFFLENVYKYNVELRLSIKDHGSEFQLQSEALSPSYTSSMMITLPPKAQVPVRLVFTPSSMMLSCSSVELYDITHSRKFKVKLFGYGGTSHVDIINSKRSGDAHVINIGEVTAGHRNVAKLIVKNSGSRSAFIKEMCYVDDKMTTALSSQHVSLSPSEFVLPPHVTKEILIIYNASHSDEVKCHSSSNQLAHVILYTGDEAVRSRLRRKLISSDPSHYDVPLVQLFLRDFSEQYLAENNLDLSSVSYKKEERLFEYCLHQLNVVLIGTAAGHHGNYPHTPLRGPITSHHNTGSHDTLSENMLTISSHSVERSMTEEAPLEEEDSMTAGWSVQPKRIILPPRPDRLEDTYKARIQLLNYTDTSMRYQLSFAKTHLVITPSQGVLKRRSDCLILVSPRIASGSHTHPLPWVGHITVHCNNDSQVIRVQIREDMELQSSSELDTTGSLSDHSPALAAAAATNKSSYASFLSSRHVVFPTTAVGHYSEQLLTVNNPRPELMQLFIHSESSPTVKSVDDTSAEQSRANYAAFWINKKSVNVAAMGSCQLTVTFMPHNEGEFSQKWIVMVTYGKENAVRIHLTFSGKAVKDLTSTTRYRILDEKAVQTSLLTATSPKRRRTNQRALTDQSEDDSTVVTPSPVSSLPIRKTANHIPYKGEKVKLETTVLQFPSTRRGESCTVKIKVYNGERNENKFEVVQPLPPFSVHNKHRIFSLQHKHAAKLPITFTPQRPRQDYHGILTITTSAGHQLLAELKGSST